MGFFEGKFKITHHKRDREVSVRMDLRTLEDLYHQLVHAEINWEQQVLTNGEYVNESREILAEVKNYRKELREAYAKATGREV